MRRIFSLLCTCDIVLSLESLRQIFYIVILNCARRFRCKPAGESLCFKRISRCNCLQSRRVPSGTSSGSFTVDQSFDGRTQHGSVVHLSSGSYCLPDSQYLGEPLTSLNSYSHTLPVHSIVQFS